MKKYDVNVLKFKDEHNGVLTLEIHYYQFVEYLLMNYPTNHVEQFHVISKDRCIQYNEEDTGDVAIYVPFSTDLMMTFSHLLPNVYRALRDELQNKMEAKLQEAKKLSDDIDVLFPKPKEA